MPVWSGGIEGFIVPISNIHGSLSHFVCTQLVCAQSYCSSCCSTIESQPKSDIYIHHFSHSIDLHIHWHRI